VLVIGAGPVGLAVALWARFFGARSVVVSEFSESRRAMASRLGATATVDGRGQVAEAFAEHAGGPPDVVFECVGVPGMLMQCVELAPARSRIVVAGVCMEPDAFLPVAALLKELSFHFVLAYHHRDWRLTLDMLEAGRIDASPMVTDVVDLAGLPTAFEALKKPTTQCKVLVEP
jgi:(R,R)-butanediol dehydrogenase/meso-butanediol dehydrogenase/diacetyl reductase